MATIAATHPHRHRISAALMASLFVLATSGTARAHDFWIEPSEFRPEPGALVTLRLRVGEHFRGDPVPLNPPLVKEFVVATDGGSQPILRRPGAEPAGVVAVPQAGVAVVGYRSLPQRVELPAADFERYLGTEGLEAVIRTRAARGESAAPGREIFSRAAKALLAVGGGRPASGHDRVLGFTLELIPERSPYALRAGDELAVMLRYEGKPLAGALVMALHGSGETLATIRTDAAGRVRVPLSRGGAWLVKAVHMVPAPAGSDADWESIWASLTFELPAEHAMAAPSSW
jgi:uncharacterized GH25 family protein